MENRRYIERNNENTNIEKSSIENIAAYDLDDYMKKWNKKCVLIDVRDKNKYNDKHILGALNVSYSDIQAGRFNYDKDKIIILYCDRGGLSMAAAKYLSRQGYNVKNVVGGLKNYLKGKK